MSYEYVLTWSVTVEADDPREACRRARDRLQVIVDSSAPIAFDWQRFEDGRPGTRALSVLHPDGEISTKTDRRM